jgi:hypothetical protein
VFFLELLPSGGASDVFPLLLPLPWLADFSFCEEVVVVVPCLIAASLFWVTVFTVP